MKHTQRPGVVFQPQVYTSMQCGINTIVEAIKPTLGPIARVVAIDYLNKTNARPELLDHGGVIARRIIELPDRDANMGAMLARSMVLRQQEEVGDGTATAAVLLQAIYNAGLRHLVAGANAMRVRHFMEAALPSILATLDAQIFPVEGEAALARMALSLCHDPEMADLLGEIFEMIGEYGQLDIRQGQGRGLKREYIEGIYYNTGLFSREMLDENDTFKTEYQNPAVFLSDFELDDPRQLYPVLKAAADADIPALVIVMRGMTERAMGAILANKRIEKFKAMALKLPGLNPEDRMAVLQDLSVLTGAVPVLQATGDSLENVTAQHFGQARRVWAERRHFGIIGGRGNPRALREHFANLEKYYRRTRDAEQRQRLQERLGRLMGGSATLWIGGATEPEIEVRKALADRTALALRTTVREGAVPGGGVALLKCQAMLAQRAREVTDPDERAAYRSLAEAFEAPVRTIYTNAGFDPSEVLAKLAFEPGPAGFDVVQARIVDVFDAGISDSALALKTAIRNAISTAALALTIDTLVHHRKLEIARE